MLRPQSAARRVPLCPRCELRGVHPDVDACLQALHEAIADERVRRALGREAGLGQMAAERRASQPARAR